MSKKISIVLIIIIILNVFMSVFSNVYAITFEEAAASREIEEDTISAADSVNNMIGAILTVTQILGVFIAMIFIVVTASRHIALLARQYVHPR